MKAGDVLPPLTREIELADMAAYGDATVDHHRLHFDAEYAAALGLPAPLVDGQMLGAIMASHIMRAAGPRAFLTALSFRFRTMVFAGDAVRCEAEVTSVADGYAELKCRMMLGDKLAVDGAARVRL